MVVRFKLNISQVRTIKFKPDFYWKNYRIIDEIVITVVLDAVDNMLISVYLRFLLISVQSQYSYAVVESLMNHLDENSKSSPKIRTSIADVLSKIIAIAAEESVG